MLVVLSVLFVGVLALFCALQVAATLMPEDRPRSIGDDPEEAALRSLRAQAEARRAHVEALRTQRLDELRQSSDATPRGGIGVRHPDAGR